jgi:hypothetical protein
MTVTATQQVAAPAIITTESEASPKGTFVGTLTMEGSFDAARYFLHQDNGTKVRIEPFCTVRALLEGLGNFNNRGCEGAQVTGTIRDGVLVAESITFGAPAVANNSTPAATSNSTGYTGSGTVASGLNADSYARAVGAGLLTTWTYKGRTTTVWR